MKINCPPGFRWLRWNEYSKPGDRILDVDQKEWRLLGKGQHNFKCTDFIRPVIRPIVKVTAADVCKEAADYLDYNDKTSIGHGSALHKKLREYATKKKVKR